MDSQDSSANPSLELTGADTDASTSATPSADNSDAAESSARSASSPKRKAAAPTAPAASDRVGQSYRLTQKQDWGIRYAALMLETQDGQRRTQQDLVDQAVWELLERLKKKGMSFPDTLAL
ncbi:hypothetical protein [Hymenobacter mucosus]|uniref:Uncharacterized protein n=1 Tax=Hymenobacter mucosus TaxID=1411120 RepID=A0A239A3H1_9BACT|nr:hypothetical protein [Hymenobacter mucosus]SNR89658.1 hypothetical protein SAMN06269173_110142 [Hymenobacter mucosus]